jgi:HSP20 family protein
MTIRDLVPKLGRDRDRMLARRGEFDAFTELQREMNRLFDDFFTDFSPVTRWGAWDRGLAGEPFSPRVDVSETESEVRISAELPGMDEQDISVEMDDTAVTLHGERKAESEEKGKHWCRKEQSYGSFQRVIPLPAEVDGERAKAKFKKGVLTVTAPKREPSPAKRKAIEIESD